MKPFPGILWWLFGLESSKVLGSKSFYSSPFVLNLPTFGQVLESFSHDTVPSTQSPKYQTFLSPWKEAHRIPNAVLYPL